MPPPNGNGPRAEGRPDARITAKITATPESGTSGPSVTDARVQVPERHSGRPLAFASQAAPCEGRSQWALMYQCGSCGGTHFGRSPVELITGKRRARCGRMVWLVIARTYRGRPNPPAVTT
jgi:hypothetical protein